MYGEIEVLILEIIASLSFAKRYFPCSTAEKAFKISSNCSKVSSLGLILKYLHRYLYGWFLAFLTTDAEH